MESKVQFVVDAELGKAIQQMLKVKDAQDRVVHGFEKIGHAGKHSEGEVSKLFGEVGKLAAGYLSFEGLKKGAELWTQALEAAGDRLVETRKDLAGLMVQGNNVFHSEELKEQVHLLAMMNGRSNKEMADSMAMIQNAFGELGEGKGKLALDTTLKLNSALGGSADATELVTKAMQVYGDSLNTVGKASDKLFAFHAALSGVEDSAQFLAAVAPEANRAGASFEHVAGSLILLSQQGGKTKETAAAAKALFKGVGDAMEEGLVSKTDDFVTALEKLSKLNPQTLRKLFGEGALGEVTRLFKTLEELRGEIDKLRGMKGEDVEKRIAAADSSPSNLSAAAISLAKSQTANVIDLQSEDLQDAAVNYEMAKLGWTANHGPMTQWMAPIIAGLSSGARNTGHTAEGKRITLDNLRKVGKNDKADLEEIQWGMGGYWQDGQWHPVSNTGAEDRKRFIELRGKFGKSFTGESYARMREMELAVDEQAVDPPSVRNPQDYEDSNEKMQRNALRGMRQQKLDSQRAQKKKNLDAYMATFEYSARMEKESANFQARFSPLALAAEKLHSLAEMGAKWFESKKARENIRLDNPAQRE